MWLNNKIYKEDLEYILRNKNIRWEILEGKTVFVTGATGVIGSLVVNALLFINQELNLNCHVVALARDFQKVSRMYKEQFMQVNNVEFIYTDICQKIDYPGQIDYIIHTASQTSSKGFLNTPVETMKTALNGTIGLLDLAVEKKIKGFVYLSTMEVYGTPTNDEKITENYNVKLDNENIRNSYPISKYACEMLCKSYASEYELPVVILRLTQTFGPGVQYNDSRVFAEFARCVIEGKDIILHTKGETARNYLYTADAATAIFMTLFSDKKGEIYNVTNENTYCSIYEMAKLVAEKCAKGTINVRVKLEKDIEQYGYAPTLKMNLDADKLRGLGWEAHFSLEDMYIRMISSMRDQKR